MDKKDFLEGVNDWNNHLVLMWLALEATSGDVLEMGCGDGSTRQLHEYCQDTKRVLYSFDTDKEWLNRFKDCENENHRFVQIINDWHIAKDICPTPTVILIDHAPGERRIVDVKRFVDFPGIMVLHDTQPPPTAADYGYERIWPLFKFKVDLQVEMNHEVNPPHNRTWASAVSNHYDVTKWRGLETGNPDYKIV